MGYLSNFTVSLMTRDTGKYIDLQEQEKIFQEIEEQSRYQFNTEGDMLQLNEAKWYDVHDDLTKISKKHPEIIIQVEVEGENRDDNWKARYLNGESESVRAKIVFPKFEEIVQH